MKPALDALLDIAETRAKRDGVAAVYAVLSLLRACYRHGQHKAFAAHCCRWSPVAATPPTVNTGDDPDEEGPRWLM